MVEFKRRITDFRTHITDFKRHIFVAFIKVYLTERSIIPSIIACVLSAAGYIVMNWLFKKKEVNHMHEALLVAKMNLMQDSMNNLLHKHPESPNTDLQVMNIIEAHMGLRKTVAALKEDLRPQPLLVQAWIGSFNFMYCARKIEGSVEIINSAVHTKMENAEWIALSGGQKTKPEDHYLGQIIVHGTKITNEHIKYCEWNGIIHCKVTLKTPADLRYLTTPKDILIKHADNITWTRRLLSRELYV